VQSVDALFDGKLLASWVAFAHIPPFRIMLASATQGPVQPSLGPFTMAAPSRRCFAIRGL
jgi:hypothetical protein